MIYTLSRCTELQIQYIITTHKKERAINKYGKTQAHKVQRVRK